MKKILISVLVFFATTNLFAQESFKKCFWIPAFDSVFLLSNSVIKFKDLTTTEQEGIRLKYQSTPFINLTEEIVVGSKKVLITRNIPTDEKFLQTITKDTVLQICHSGFKGFVKFEEDGKLWVNKYLRKNASGNYTRFPNYYFQLKNRETVSLRFKEFSVSALVIPIKYRFKGKNGLQEEFSATPSTNIFAGRSWGKSSFFHQEKVGNKTNTWKITGGFLFGASSVSLDTSNTSLAAKPLGKDVELTKGLVNIGFGLAYSYNKINLGAFYGFDYALGAEAFKWNYNKKPWIGIAIGYSLFNF